jgi:hypothetical protein
VAAARWGTRLWLIVAGSFYAQCTAIFVNQPFIWPMRFGFSAVLLTALAFFSGRGRRLVVLIGARLDRCATDDGRGGIGGGRRAVAKPNDR